MRLYVKTSWTRFDYLCAWVVISAAWTIHYKPSEEESSRAEGDCIGLRLVP